MVKTVIKWLVIIGGGLAVLVILILLVVPLFVDAKQFKPVLEKQVSDLTGRPFRVGEDVNLTLFPWAGVSFSDLHLGNPPGFEEKEFVAIDGFEVRVKLIPLIFRDVQVKRFVIRNPRIFLVKNTRGQVNWQFGQPPKTPPPEAGSPPPARDAELPIKSLVVGDFSIENGTLVYVDQAAGTRKTVDQLNVAMRDLSFDRPVRLEASARLDNQPVAVQGTLGPLGKDPGQGSIPIDLTLQALSEVKLNLKGTLASAARNPKADLAISAEPFSARKLAAAFGENLLPPTADAKALEKVALKAGVSAAADRIDVSQGQMILDDTTIDFTARITRFDRPDIAFDVRLDRIDLDRYLPPQSKDKPAPTAAPLPPPAKQGTDYGPLRRLVLDGKVNAGSVTVNKAVLSDITLAVRAKDGIVRIAPLNLNLYQGRMNVDGTIDVSRDRPVNNFKINLEQVQVGPLLRDQTGKDLLEGALHSAITLSMSGDSPEAIKRSLNGEGSLRFGDGAIKGIDLAGMVRNVKTALGLEQAGGQKPRTDFSELLIPFSIQNGLFSTPESSLKSPLLRVLATGSADLVKESLDFRIEPKAVATIKGQGDEEQRAGILVPVVVSGSFAAPQFAPDLKAIAGEKIEQKLLESDKAKKILESEKIKPHEETIKGTLKKFLN